MQNKNITYKMLSKIQWNENNTIFWNQILAHCHNNACDQELNTIIDSLSTLASSLRTEHLNCLERNNNLEISYLNNTKYEKIVYYLHKIYNNAFCSAFYDDFQDYIQTGSDLQNGMTIDVFLTNSLNDFSIYSSAIKPNKYVLKRGVVGKHPLIVQKNVHIVKIGGMNMKLLDYKTLGNLNPMSIDLEILNTYITRIVFNLGNIVPFQFVNIYSEHLGNQKQIVRKYMHLKSLWDFYKNEDIIEVNKVGVLTLAEQLIFNIIASPFDHHSQNIFLKSTPDSKLEFVNLDNARLFGNSDEILNRGNGKWISGYRSSITDRHYGINGLPTVIEAASIPLSTEEIVQIRHKLLDANSSLYKLNIFLDAHNCIIRSFPPTWFDTKAIYMNIKKRIKKSLDIINLLPSQNLTIENLIYAIFPMWKYTKLLQYTIFVKEGTILNDNRLDKLIHKSYQLQINIAKVWDYALHLDMQYSLDTIAYNIRNDNNTLCTYNC